MRYIYIVRFDVMKWVIICKLEVRKVNYYFANLKSARSRDSYEYN